ncbi:methyltransferase domain-containing protein [Prescottella soli]|uniref:Methyltransferase domain-containing protein n=1 Tax=Prescottella soli TaxID=1543852 RepID=A0ABW9FQJ6_9NOCA
MKACRGCSGDLEPVLDLGWVPAADHFPPAATPVTENESNHHLTLHLCHGCALAQLGDDDTEPEVPLGIEPQALRDQAVAAVQAVASEGWLRGRTVVEFGSPHGGTWLPLLAERGFQVEAPGTPAAVVLDSFGIMHEPDQRAAFRERAAAVADDGVLLLQFHSLAAILSSGEWNALRHGHFAYYSLTALQRLLHDAGLHVVDAWEFDLYGGTVLLAAQRTPGTRPAPAVRRILAEEAAAGVTVAAMIHQLQGTADEQAATLRTWLESEARRERRIFAYGAASRSVSLFARAGVDRTLVTAVADASYAKQGRRMPGTDVPIISPEQLLQARPDRVLLTLPDLLPEVQRHYPELDGRWRIAADGTPPAPTTSRRSRRDSFDVGNEVHP